MLAGFEEVMRKLSTLGFDRSVLTDCSDVIPAATGTVAEPFIPSGLSLADLQPACSASPFPTVATVAGKSAVI